MNGQERKPEIRWATACAFVILFSWPVFLRDRTFNIGVIILFVSATWAGAVLALYLLARAEEHGGKDH